MNLKALREQKNDLIIKMQELTDLAINEKRAMSDEEKTNFDTYEEQVKQLNETIERCEKEFKSEIINDPAKEKAHNEERAEQEQFVDYVKGIVLNKRADVNFDIGTNGAVIPTSIAKKILEVVKDHCRIFEYGSKFNVGGTLSFPVYDETTQAITMSYAEEFSTLNATSGKFTSIELKGFLAAALTKVSRSLINNVEFDLFSYIIKKMGEAIATFLETELLKGTASKIAGLSTAEVVATTLTADSLIDVQDSVKTVFQHNARWIMSSSTKNKIRKLKDGMGNYLLERDYANGNGGWLLLGKPVELTDVLADGDLFYGDFSGLAIKIAENPELQILNEQFATEHAVGVVAWLEIDAGIIEPQKIKRLTVAD